MYNSRSAGSERQNFCHSVQMLKRYDMFHLDKTGNWKWNVVDFWYTPVKIRFLYMFRSKFTSPLYSGFITVFLTVVNPLRGTTLTWVQGGTTTDNKYRYKNLRDLSWTWITIISKIWLYCNDIISNFEKFLITTVPSVCYHWPKWILNWFKTVF